MQVVCILASRQGAPLAQITTTRLTYNLGRMQTCFPKPLLHQIKDERAKSQNHDVYPRRGRTFLRCMDLFQRIHSRMPTPWILGTFYEGVVWDVRMILDTATNGNFLTRTEEDAKVLLNNFASGSLDDKPRHACIDSRQTKQIKRLTKQLEEFTTKNREMASNLDKSRNALYVCEAEQGSMDERNEKNKRQAGTQEKSKIEDILEKILASQRRIETGCDILEEQLKQPEPINALILRGGKALDEPYQHAQGEEPIAAKESPANVWSNDYDAEGADDERDQPIILTNPSSNTTEPVKHN